MPFDASAVCGVNAHTLNTRGRGETIAAEARRYLDVVDTFAALGADPHGRARTRAADARAREHTVVRSGRRVRGWRR
jgi:hypothetical protein